MTDEKSVTKPAGWDWDIEYEFDGEDRETMSVFGQATIEEALKEARYSLDGVEDMNVGTYVIYGARRSDAGSVAR